MGLLRAVAAATPFLLLIGIVLGVVAPGTYRAWMAEDGWGEWATFLAFALASALAGRLATMASRPRLEQVGAAGLALFCLFVAGEEISWGQRLFGFVPPEVFLEKNYQQEANLHNLLKDIFDSRWQVTAIALGYGVFAPLAALQGKLPVALSPSRLLAPGFAAVALLEIAYPFDLAGELAELALGISCLADAAIRISGEGHLRAGARLALSLGGGALVVAVPIGPGLDLVRHGSQDLRSDFAREELRQLAVDLARAGVTRPKLFSKQRVHKRLFTASRERYLRFGVDSAFLEHQPTPAEESGGSRRDRRGYFLDPWNQPYWLAFEPAPGLRGRVLVYSFGPNRRRDSDLSDLPASSEKVADRLVGDDLGFVIDLPLD